MSWFFRMLRVLREYIDVVVFAAALATTAPLMGWWAILVRRNIHAIDQLSRHHAQLSASSPEQLTRALQAIDSATNRQLVMITGETALGAALFTLFAGALFAIARRRRLAQRRMQRLMQFSSHELKTPIAGLRTLLQTLQRGALPAASQAKFLEQGVNECNRLEHLAETILAYQSATSRERPRLEEIPPGELVGEVLRHRAGSFGDEKVQWTPSSVSAVRADRDGFRVVLENLLDNARKYGAGQVTLEERVEQDRWCLMVTDSGMGFEPGEAEELFDPFTRRSRDGVTHGSGLGLFLSRQLARGMRGDLRAQSPGPGQGSTFVLQLELAPATKEGSHRG